MGTVTLRLNDVEAYLGVGDPACHTFGGRRTERTDVMWGEAGRAYVYLIYGIHNCLNVVTVGPDHPEAVLIRGGELIHGHDIARARRGETVSDKDLTNGPGKLCQALAISREENAADLSAAGSALRICDDGFRYENDRIRRLPRIGVDYAGEAASWPLRLTTSASV